MTDRDDRTLAFYAKHAAAYAGRSQLPVSAELDHFLSLLPQKGKILELGCGAGRDSEAMLSRGFDVMPTDGTPELARLAEKRLGIPVGILLFEDLDVQELSRHLGQCLPAASAANSAFRRSRPDFHRSHARRRVLCQFQGGPRRGA